MAKARAAVRAPQLEPVLLSGLDAGSVEDLRGGADLEGLSFADVEAGSLDLPGATLFACELAGVSVGEADLRGLRLRESRLGRVGAPVVRASRCDWRDVAVEGCRFGSCESYDATWRSVRVEGCRIDYANLRGAQLTDVAFTDCAFEELDLAGAKVVRATFAGCRIGHLDVQHAELGDVDLRGAEVASVAGVLDLRGATVDGRQLAALAPLLAAGLGLRVED